MQHDASSVGASGVLASGWRRRAPVGYEAGRPAHTMLSEDGGDEWYVLATHQGAVVLHHFSDGDADIAVVMPPERWREIGHVVLETSALIR